MINFNDFKNSWLQGLDTSTNQKFATQFSSKLLSQWLDLSENNEQIIECDSSINYGLSVIYLQSDESDKREEIENKVFLVVNKYALQINSILQLNEGIIKILQHFYRKSDYLQLPEQSKSIVSLITEETGVIVLIVNEEDIDTEELISFYNLKSKIKAEISNLVDIQHISLRNIYELIQEEEEKTNYNFNFKADIRPSGNNIFMGAIELLNLYDFLCEYERNIGDINRIYEKNVRNYQGAGKQVNKGIRKTILLYPQYFGMFNNGITIVADEITQNAPNIYNLKNPFIVNGCQTTRTIYETLKNYYPNYKESWNRDIKKLITKKDNDDFDSPSNYEEWKQKLQEARVLVKFVQTGEQGDKILINTTKYTNSQIPVTGKDFFSINSNFKQLQRLMESRYQIFVEISRGSWNASKDDDKKKFKDVVTAIDLIKTYSAGWLNKPGTAFGKNPPFVPGGAIFQQIMENESFTVKDAYCAYLLFKISGDKNGNFKFGLKERDSDYHKTRGATRYLFYYVVIYLLRDILTRFTKTDRSKVPTKLLTSALLQLFENGKYEILFNNAAQLIDEFMTKSEDVNALTFNNDVNYKDDLNAYMKNDNLHLSEKLDDLIKDYLRVMKRISAGVVPYDIIANSIKNLNDAE